jgi:hypothetical protein
MQQLLIFRKYCLTFFARKERDFVKRAYSRFESEAKHPKKIIMGSCNSLLLIVLSAKHGFMVF